MELLYVSHLIKKSKARKKDGKLPIHTRLHMKGKNVDIATGLYTNLEEWDPHRQQVSSGDREKDETINRRIHQIKTEILECENVLRIHGKEVTATAVRDQYKGKGRIGKTLGDTFREHNEYFSLLVEKGEKAKASLTKYRAIERFIGDFLKKEYNVKDLQLDRLDHPFVEKFDRYLRTIRQCGNNSTVKNVRFLKKVIRFAIKNGWLEQDPFIRYDGKVIQEERDFLEEEEIERIRSKEFQIERLARVRDLFLFSCYTGLSFSDVKGLKKENLVKDNKKRWWLRIHRKKTGQKADIFLLPSAYVILEKYWNASFENKEDGYLLPVPCNQKVNAYLKEIADLCGIHKKLTFHIARHTFATTITLSNGVPIETVSSQLGHSNIKQTQHYAKMVNARVGKDMEKLMGKY